MIGSVFCKFILLKTIMIFYTGSYTQDETPALKPEGKGIGCFILDVESGKVELLQYTKQRSPSYLAISDDKKYLYAIEEMFEELNPQVFAYRINQDGKLSLINSQKIKGDYTCHLAIVKDQLVVASYVSGNVLSFQILEDGSLAPFHQEIKHSGTGPNEERQEAAHAHMVYPIDSDRMYVVDLTLDKAKAYQLNHETKKWVENSKNDITIEAGAGARHMVMDKAGKFAYVLSELSGEVFIAKTGNDQNEIVQKISFVPENYQGDFGGAAIRLHPSGEYLYASCRGSDTISIFKIDKDSNKLTLVSSQSTEGKTPRDFNIDPTGKWLIAANQDSNILVVFEINQETGKLMFTSKVTVETPVNICWL